MEETLGNKIEQLYDLKAKKDALNAELSELNPQIDTLEFAIITAMEELGLDKVQSNCGTVSRKVSLYPQIKDMPAFLEWIVDNGMHAMIQKRVSSGVFSEYYESTGEYPSGIDAFAKTSINFRRSK